MKRKPKIIRTIPLYIGFLFLFNPNITVIDLLPDFVGYMLICMGIYRLCDLGGKLTEAYEAFKKMALVDAGKILAVLWIFGMSVPGERNTSILLWTFIFSIIELIILLPAYTKLFAGLTELGYRYPSDALFGMRKKGSRTDSMRNLTYVFVAAKAVLTFLPELADLSNYSYDETTAGFANIYRYIGIIRFLAIVPVAVLGVVWLICSIYYFHRITADKRLMTSLEGKYEDEVLTKKGIFVRRGYKTFMLIFTVALVLTVDLRLDDVNMIPDFLSALLLLIAILTLRKYCGKKVAGIVLLSVGLLFVSVAADILEYKFFDMYYYTAIIKSDEVRRAYVTMSVVSGAKSLISVGVVAAICGMLSGSITEHTGYVLGMEREGEREKTMISNLHGELKNGLKLAVVVFALYAVSDICFNIFAPSFAYIGLINFVFAALAIGVFVKAVAAIGRAIDTKYMLE